MKIAVLMGGNSSEREISLTTGRAVMEAVDKIGEEVVPCPYEGDISSVLPMLKEADVVFVALHGGEGENGTVQKLLEDHRIKYTGSGPEASALAMDKHRTKKLLRQNELPTPLWLFIRSGTPDAVELSNNKFTYPVVVKPNGDGSTMGVSIVKKASGLDLAIQLASEFGGDVLIEEYIPGREITVGILGDSVLPIIEIIPSHEFYDYECKYAKGMSQYICPADLSTDLASRISTAAKQIVDLLGCRHYCRVDFRINPLGEFYCLEVNTLPGFTGTSLVPKAAKQAGLVFDQLVKRIIGFALE